MLKDTQFEYYDRNNKKVLTFNDGGPYVVEPAEIMDWSWEYDSTLGTIRNFRRSKNKYTFTVGINSESKDDRDALCNAFSADVIAEQPGRLVLRGWELKCYIVEASHSIFTHPLDHRIAFSVITDEPGWTRRTIRYFNSTHSADTGSTSGTDLWRDYVLVKGEGRRGYNYNYNMSETHSDTVRAAGDSNGYMLLIYGPCTNPIIYLGGRPISVKVSVKAGEQLRITSDGNDKRIELLSASGDVTNIFNLRDKEHSQFLTLGSVTEVSYGQLKFDMTLIERRSEPSWN